MLRKVEDVILILESIPYYPKSGQHQNLITSRGSHRGPYDCQVCSTFINVFVSCLADTQTHRHTGDRNTRLLRLCAHRSQLHFVLACNVETLIEGHINFFVIISEGFEPVTPRPPLKDGPATSRCRKSHKRAANNCCACSLPNKSHPDNSLSIFDSLSSFARMMSRARVTAETVLG